MKFQAFLLIFTFFSASLYAQEIPAELLKKYNQSVQASKSNYKLGSSLSEDALKSVAIKTISMLKSSYGANLDLIADQLTTGSRFRSYRSFANEPRIALSNNSENQTFTAFFEGFSNAEIQAANYIYRIEEDLETIIIGGKDVTESARAGLYFFKGISGGFTGLLFDQGFDINTDQSYDLEKSLSQRGLNLVPSDQLVSQSISDLEKALEIVESIEAGNYDWVFVESGRQINKSAFKKMVHSFIAKILISEPLSPDEFLDYSKILFHAKEGLDSSFPNIIFKTIGNEGELADKYNEFAGFIVGCDDENTLEDCNAYLNTDIKLIHLMDENYPTTFLPDGSSRIELLDPATSDDPRLNYFKYTTYTGFFTEEFYSHPKLYSNYVNVRAYAENDWWKEGYPIVLMAQAELQYIKAEAEFKLGNTSNADAALQNSPYGTVPADFSIDLPSVQLGYLDANGFAFNGPPISFDEQAFINILHKEYSVELNSFTTIGTHLFFMRRSGLLQELSPTVLPVPIKFLIDSPTKKYSSGGLKNYENGRSAKRHNVWHFDNTYPPPFNFEAEVLSEQALLSWAPFPSSYPDQPTGFIISANEVNDTLSAQKNTFLANSLENNVSYSYSIRAIHEERLSYSRGVFFTPNIFSTNSRIDFEDRVLSSNTYTMKRWLRNTSNSTININSIRKKSTNGVYTDIFKDWLDFIELDISGKSIAPGDSLLARISFNSYLYGAYPPVQFDFDTNQGLFTIFASSIYVDERRLLEDVPDWTAFHNIPDSIAFGALQAGETDAIQIEIENKSLYIGRVDTVFTYLRDEAGNYIPENVFSISGIERSIRVEPGEILNLTIHAKPLNNEPYEAFLRGSGDMFESYDIGRITVNKGERYEEPEVELFQNYPNPFNPSTRIEFSLPNTTNVTLEVFNLIGQKVTTLVNTRMSSGNYSVRFDASNLSSGMYFYRLQTSGKVLVEKMLLIK